MLRMRQVPARESASAKMQARVCSIAGIGDVLDAVNESRAEIVVISDVEEVLLLETAGRVVFKE